MIPLRSSAQEVAGLLRLCCDGALFTEVLVYVGFTTSLSALAPVCRSVALATRSPEWRLLAFALAHEFGLLSVALIPAHPAAPVTSFGWKSLFAGLFKARHEKFGVLQKETEAQMMMTMKKKKKKTNSFNMAVVVRLRPAVRAGGAFNGADKYGDDDNEDNGMFLPLHQRLQLERLGHDTSLEQEVHSRMQKTVSGGGGDGQSGSGAERRCAFREQRLARDRREEMLKQEPQQAATFEGDILRESGVGVGGDSSSGRRNGEAITYISPSIYSTVASKGVVGVTRSLDDQIQELEFLLSNPPDDETAAAPADCGPKPPTPSPAALGTALSSDDEGMLNPPAAATPGSGEATTTEEEEEQRAVLRVKLVNAEDNRLLVNLPGAGLRYFTFDAVLGAHSSPAASLLAHARAVADPAVEFAADADATLAKLPMSDGREALNGKIHHHCRVLAPDSQEGFYVRCLVPTLDAFLQGFSCCVFAYGQTGSGKTHTMIGEKDTLQRFCEASLGSRRDGKACYRNDDDDDEEEKEKEQPGKGGGRAWGASLPSLSRERLLLAPGAGMLPRVLCDTMDALTLARSGLDASVTCTYLEVYNDKVSCLLGGGRTVSLFRIGRGAAADHAHTAGVGGASNNDNDAMTTTGSSASTSCSNGGEGSNDQEQPYHLSGATEMPLTSAADALEMLAKGEAFKHKAATAMNDRSSRAHTIFMLTLTQRYSGKVKRSRFSLVDLGGSEQVKRSKAEGARLTEAIQINKSLMVLGKVIDALVQKRSHVPFYESKLTTLLQPALGGATRTTVFVTASPDRADAEETLHSLRFGERCRLVTNEVAASRTASMAEVLKALDASIQSSEKRLAELEAAGAKDKAEADAAKQKMGQGMADEMRVQAGAGKAEYSMLDDDAGKYLAEKNRIRALRRRKMEILGGGGAKQ